MSPLCAGWAHIVQQLAPFPRVALPCPQMETVRLRLGELLVDARIITREQLEEVLELQKSDGRRLGTLLVEQELVNETQLTQILSQQLSVPWVSLYHVDFSKRLLNLVPAQVAQKYCLVPIYVRHVRGQGDTLYVAMDDPTNVDALRECASWSGLPTRAMIASPADIRRAVEIYYGVTVKEESTRSHDAGTAGGDAQQAEPEQPSEAAEDEELAEREEAAASEEEQSVLEAEPPEPVETTSEAQLPAEPAASEPPPAATSLDHGTMEDTSSVGRESIHEVSVDDDIAPAVEASERELTEAGVAEQTQPKQDETEPAETKPAETKPAETKPAETKPAETKPAETKPAETKPAETKPAETKPAETKPAETKPAETKPAETKPAETEPAETEPAETEPAETEPAETEPAETADDDIQVEVGEEMTLEELLAQREKPPGTEPAEPPLKRSKSGKMLSLTLLDGTTLALPVQRKRRSRPSLVGAVQSEPAVPPAVDRAPREVVDEHLTGKDGLGVRDILAALRAASHGVDATEVLGRHAKWEAMVAALLAILVRKGLITEEELLEEMRKI